MSSVIIAALILSCLLAALPGFAGDGSAGGGGDPLRLIDSTPVDGQEGVPLDVKIKLTFNKNVVNMSVKDNNMRCFKLFEGGHEVACAVQMADDQIYRELRREVVLPTLTVGVLKLLILSHS